MNNKICALIITYNEELHIARCLRSLDQIASKVYIVDSYSNDSTIKIISKFRNVEWVQNKFINHAQQYNFGLTHFDIKEDWVIRIDADEYLDEELRNSLIAFNPKVEVNAVYFNRYITFMGKLLRWGGMSSYWMLRMWRTGLGECENKWMDEHILVRDEKPIRLTGKLIDENLNSLSWWSVKHVNYSTREAIEILLNSTPDQINRSKVRNIKRVIRQELLKRCYNKFPLFSRPFLYFIHRFVFRFGFLDGIPGVIWCFLQGFWYRFLVDSKVYEIKKYADTHGVSLKSSIFILYDIRV